MLFRSKGEQIYIQEDLEEWYRIKPVAESYGWVSDKFLVFKSKDLSGHKTAQPRTFVDKEALDQQPASGDQDQVENKPVEEPVVEDPVIKEPAKIRQTGIISVTGYAEPYEDEGADGIYYKIVSGGEPVCYIQGVNHMLGRFVHQQVTVEGTVNEKLYSRYAHPVIVVVKVRLIL